MAKRGKQKQKQKTNPVAERPAGKQAKSTASAAGIGESRAEEEASSLEATAPDFNESADAASEPADAVELSEGSESTPAIAAEESAADEAETVATEEPEAQPAQPARPKRARTRERRSPYLVLADYEQRSLAHVPGLPEQLDAPGLWRGVAYRVGNHRLASGFDEVIEILPMPAVTHIPGSLAWMLGVANIRGTLLPVIDLKQFLEGERTVLQEKQRVLVVHQPGGDVAVTIDELYGQRSFVDSQGVDAAAVADGRYAYFVERAYRINDYDWGIFSLDRLARTPEFRQAAA